MPVSDQHSQYIEYLSQWKQNRDVVAGGRKVKEGETKYLPKPMPNDLSAENKTRYDQYVERASFVNFTGSTEEGMLGMVFRKDMIAELNPSVDYLVDNVNGFGLSLDQLARASVANLLQTGRGGLLVEYPVADAGLSVQAVRDRNLRANILSYNAESVVNWRTAIVDGIKYLTLLVLQEPTEVIAADGFSVTEEIYHRVLSLVDGVYTQSLYNEDDELVESNIIPRKRDGSVWNKIPFVFLGAVNNDENIDKAPLTDLSDLNIAHYRNSADYEESCYMVGQPTPYASGFTQSWIENIMKGKEVRIGSREFLLLPEGASAGLLQVAPNIMPREGMIDKEAQAIKLGARLISDSSGTETAEAAKIRFAGQNSKLGTVVGNIQAGFIQAIEYAMEFMGGEGVELEINTDFYDKSLDPQMVMAQIQLLDRGIIAKKDFRGVLRAGSLIKSDRTDEDIEAEAENEVMGETFNGN